MTADVFLLGKVEFEGRDLARENGVVWLSGAFSLGKITHVKLDLARLQMVSRYLNHCELDACV